MKAGWRWEARFGFDVDRHSRLPRHIESARQEPDDNLWRAKVWTTVIGPDRARIAYTAGDGDNAVPRSGRLVARGGRGWRRYPVVRLRRGEPVIEARCHHPGGKQIEGGRRADEDRPLHS